MEWWWKWWFTATTTVGVAWGTGSWHEWCFPLSRVSLFQQSRRQQQCKIVTCHLLKSLTSLSGAHRCDVNLFNDIIAFVRCEREKLFCERFKWLNRWSFNFMCGQKQALCSHLCVRRPTPHRNYLYQGVYPTRNQSWWPWKVQGGPTSVVLKEGCQSFLKIVI